MIAGSADRPAGSAERLLDMLNVAFLCNKDIHTGVNHQGCVVKIVKDEGHGSDTPYLVCCDSGIHGRRFLGVSGLLWLKVDDISLKW